MNPLADELARQAEKERAAGNLGAAEILQTAADFMERHWPHEKPGTPIGIERGIPRGDK